MCIIAAASQQGSSQQAAARQAAAAAQPGAGPAAPAGARREWPLLRSLGPEDHLFVQHQEAVAAAYAAIGANLQPELSIYSYRVPANTDLFSLCARLALPYESVATLNRLDRPGAYVTGKLLLIPDAPGIFVPERPASDLETLLSYRDLSGSLRLDLSGGAMRYLPGAGFSQEERSLFLGRLFRFPLPSAKVTSGFGQRVSPVTGRVGLHAGIDLAAPAGTEVYAAREGIVTFSGYDPELGEHLVIAHEGGWSTVYGHLSTRLAQLNQKVESGTIIGRVGSTGESTGPHLHFEVRSQGLARDPATLIPGTGR